MGVLPVPLFTTTRRDDKTGHTLLWSDTIEESFFQTVQWLDICGWNRIILSLEKFVFGVPRVDFAVFTITMTDVRPCSRYLEAIHDFP